MRENVLVRFGHRIGARLLVAAVGLLFLGSITAFGHCDTLDGPVVKAAMKALKTGNPNYVSIWVQKGDDSELRAAFAKTMKVRRLISDARELADMYFFETIVRLHRAGEGEPYTGVKPAGTAIAPIIRILDTAFETGLRADLLSEFPAEERDDIARRFEHVTAVSKYDVNNVQAGREYVKRYVEFIHFVEHRFEELN